MKNRYYSILIFLFCLAFCGGLWLKSPHTPDTHSFSGEGYGGPIEMNMSLLSNGTIQSIHLIKHHETSSYIKNLKDFLTQFIDRPVQSPLLLGQDIDAISGATITSTAITSAVRRERARILKTTDSESPETLKLKDIIIPSLLALAAIAAFMLHHNPLRWAVLIGSMIFFGIISHSMLSILQITQANLGLAPGFFHNTLWWMLIAVSFLSAFIVGRIYCGYLCPFAAVSEIFFLLKIHRPLSSKINPTLDQRTRGIKYILLFLIMGLTLIFNSNNIGNIEPFITLFTASGTKLAWLFLACMLILGLFHFRFWCQYLCPVGALTGLVSVLSIFKIKPTASCTRCGECTSICPTHAITADKENIPHIDSAECISCAKCLRTCPAQALKITRTRP